MVTDASLMTGRIGALPPRASVRPTYNDGLDENRRALLWAILRRALRDAVRGDAGAVRFLVDVGADPVRLKRALRGL